MPVLIARSQRGIQGGIIDTICSNSYRFVGILNVLARFYPGNSVQGGTNVMNHPQPPLGICIVVA